MRPSSTANLQCQGRQLAVPQAAGGRSTSGCLGLADTLADFWQVRHLVVVLLDKKNDIYRCKYTNTEILDYISNIVIQFVIYMHTTRKYEWEVNLYGIIVQL